MKQLCLALVCATTFAACATSRTHYAPVEDLPFSNAVLVGDTLYIAGHLGLDPETRQPPADAAEEARLLMESFTGTIAAAGMSTEDLVRVQLFCADVSLYATFNEVYRQYLSEPFPARAFVGSGKLLRGARYEILGIAVRR